MLSHLKNVGTRNVRAACRRWQEIEVSVRSQRQYTSNLADHAVKKNRIYSVSRRYLAASASGDGENVGSSSSSSSKNDDSEPERFAMPDRDMELKLASIQTTISDHYKRGEFSKALEVSQNLLKQTQSHFGQDHPATASAFNNIGLMQKLLGDFIEARRHYTAAMRIYGKVVGRDHASYAMTLHNLGNLNKSQVHFDTSLKAVERLNLVETALEYFEEALAIRQVELGDDHPHTIATLSSMGSTLAAQVLHQHRYVQHGNETSGNKPKYVSLNPEALTQQGWEAAEKHLRQAMEVSISNPRGKNVTRNKKRTQPKSLKKQQKDQSSAKMIQTLSAAAAGQNLAVFLKSRALTEDPYNQDMLQEAQILYQQVLQVRSQLLPSPQHPDLLATKYSLAELLSVMGDNEAANLIRQEILDDYEPTPSTTGADDNEDNFSTSLPSRSSQIMVEKTSATNMKS